MSMTVGAYGKGAVMRFLIGRTIHHGRILATTGPYHEASCCCGVGVVARDVSPAEILERLIRAHRS